MTAKERFLQLQSLYRAGQYAAAATGLTTALRAAPHEPNLLHLMAQTAEAQGERARAILFYRRALAAHPDWLEAQGNLARLLSAQGEHAEAIALMTRLTAQHPAQPQLWEALAKFCHQSGDLPAAVAAWQKALGLSPERQDWRAQSLLLQRQLCDWRLPVTDIEKLPPQATIVLTDDPAIQKQSALRHAEAIARITLPQAEKIRHNNPEPNSSPLAGEARWGGAPQATTTGLSSAPLSPASPPLPQPLPQGEGSRCGDRIRLGYLSADFHAHATAYLMAELFSLHDRSRFEIFVYSYGVEDGSPIRQRIQNQAEHFVTLNALTARDAARRIQEDRLDILIDLKGYTRGAKPEILACRPAPVQMHWLGYPGTTGAPFIDYYIGDAVTIPFGDERFFSEKILRLPHCYQINDRQRAIAAPQPRDAYGLPQDGLVLASFNQTYKITPEHFAVWCAILRELPDATLWLLQSNSYAPENLRRAAAAQGVDPARLAFAPPAPLPEHLARYAHVDLALDTFPVGGHTTTSDALWASVPVVTLAGRSFVARVAASLLTAAGLPQLVTATPEAYKTLILALARDPAQRDTLHRHLHDNRLTLPLFDTPRFVRDFEAMLCATCEIRRF